ncbi:PR domain zinc finger protein 10, partial [Hyalella azteca]|uniref:PR domain zinc finger protein 10 n=1 Tax=Hyalella azteca TaxID=294128 RepID=A0A8B7N1N9_HYAAZ
MLTHSDRRDFKCPSCGNAFKRKDKLKDHQKRMHSKPTDAVLRDEQHTEKVEAPPMIPPSTFNRPYHCKLCQLGFKRRGMLVNHLLKCHPKVPLCSVQELNQPLPNTKLNY